MRPAAGRVWSHPRGANLSSENLFLTSLRLELAWFSGRHWLSGRGTGGAGVVLRFERVRPRRAARFQPLRSHEITPGFLDRTIRALKRWKFDIVSMDEVCHRAVTSPTPRRFVGLTFDGGYKDMIASAYPVLSRHGVPFTVYLPTAFPDRLGEAWWLALEEIIARESRISLVMDRKELRFDIEPCPKNISSTNFSGAGCARCRRRICRPRSTISASDTRSTSRRCRARHRWTGTTWQSSRPIPW